mmetsp:Transcript_11515/g.23219  ORF Transcript_11515/g.23219 Transcript_11515/m.23219 type:complete len:104 (-) Transcript_11515:9-320(-)
MTATSTKRGRRQGMIDSAFKIASNILVDCNINQQCDEVAMKRHQAVPAIKTSRRGGGAGGGNGMTSRSCSVPPPEAPSRSRGGDAGGGGRKTSSSSNLDSKRS